MSVELHQEGDELDALAPTFTSRILTRGALRVVSMPLHQRRLSRFRLSPVHLTLVSNASSMVGTTMATAGLGVLFWLLAARQFPSAAVGIGSASISAMVLLGTLPVLGLQTLIVGELRRRPGEEAPLIATAIAAAGAAGAALGLLFAVAASQLSTGLRPIGETPGSVGLFALGVALTAITLVADQALIGLLRGDVQFGRNLVFASAKLLTLAVVVFWTSSRFGLTIYATWVSGSLASLVLLAGLVAVKGHLTRASWPRWAMFRGLGRVAAAHQMLNLAIQAPALLMPVVVTVVLSAALNGYFYTAWMTTGLIFVGPEALGMVLYAIGARSQAELGRSIRLTLGLSLLISLAGNLVVFAGASQILSVFGRQYAEHAAWVLRIIALGAFPLILKQHYIAVSRIRGRLGRAAILMSAAAVVEILCAGIGARLDGLIGLSLGWLLSVSVVAILFAPAVLWAAWQAGLEERRHDRQMLCARTDP